MKKYLLLIGFLLVLLLGLSSQDRHIVPKIKVFNPTEYERTQYILYGHHDRNSTSAVMRLPRSFINIAKVTVPPNHDGEVEILTETDEPFDLGAAFKDLSKKGWRLSLTVNNQSMIFETPQLLVDHKRVKIYLSKIKVNNVIAELVTYVFHKANYIKYELSLFCENKTQYRTNISAKLDIITNHSKNITNLIRHGHPDRLLENVSMIDGQGRRWMGVLFFHNNEVLKDEVEKNTLLAEYKYPLYGVVKWNWWGPWKKEITAFPQDYVDKIHLEKSKINYYEPLGHFGWLLNKRPGDTGFQQEFGTVSHLDTVYGYSAKNMYADQLITNQEACRPTHFFEDNLDIVRAKNHPQWVTWNEVSHYNKGVSPDQLGRTYEADPTRDDWYGKDYQHYSTTWLSEDFILNGSMGSLFELRHAKEKLLAGLTLPSTHPRWSTNTPLIGREGRTYLGIVYIWLTTGDRTLITHVAQHIRELLEPTWMGRNAIGPIKPTRVLDDPRTGIPGPAWIIWEDAHFVFADALSQVMHDVGLYDVEQTLNNITKQVAISVVQYGYHPKIGKIGIAQKWDDGLPINDYDDPDQFTPSDGTDYQVWSLPCLMIVQRLARENELIFALANKWIERTYEMWGRENILYNPALNQYLGAK